MLAVNLGLGACFWSAGWSLLVKVGKIQIFEIYKIQNKSLSFFNVRLNT